MPDDLIGTSEAATLLGVDKSTIHRWVGAGLLTVAVRLPRDNGAMLFHRADIDALAKRRAATRCD